MGALYGTNPYLSGPHAIALRPGVPLHRREVVLHPERLRAGVHRSSATCWRRCRSPPACCAYKAIAARRRPGHRRPGVERRPAARHRPGPGRRARRPQPAAGPLRRRRRPQRPADAAGHGRRPSTRSCVIASASAAASRSLAVGIKLTAGLLLPFAIAAGGPLRGGAAPARPAGRRRRRPGAGRVGSSWRCSAPACFNLLATVQRSQSEGDWHSIPGFIVHSAGPGHRRPRRRLRAGGRVRRSSSSGCCAASGAGSMDWIDGGRLGDGGDAGGRQLAAALVRGLAAAARRAGRPTAAWSASRW